MSYILTPVYAFLFLYCKTIAETNDVIEREFIYSSIKTFKWKIIASFQRSALLLLTTKKNWQGHDHEYFIKWKKKVQISNIWRHALSSDDEWLKKKEKKKKKEINSNSFISNELEARTTSVAIMMYCMKLCFRAKFNMNKSSNCVVCANRNL